MYSLNGVSLHEGHSGWRILRAGTSTQGGITNSINKTKTPFRPGYVVAPYTFSEQLVILVVRTPRDRLDELLALCAAASVLTRTDDATKEAMVVLASAIPSSDAPFDATFDVTITLEIPSGVWRDVTAVEETVSVTSPSQAISGWFDNLSAPVFDMDVYLKGVFGEFSLVDNGGSSLFSARAWPGSSSTGLLYQGSTGRAFLANDSDPWVPVADRTQYVDVSGNGGFRLTPRLVSGNPANRDVSLTITTLTQTSTTLRIRAKRAYRMN